MPTPDEFFLLLALVVAMLPLQAHLARSLHRKSTAGTSFFDCFFAISNADFHAIKDKESEEFRATLKAYKRRYIYVMIPIFAVIFGVYLWFKPPWPPAG